MNDLHNSTSANGTNRIENLMGSNEPTTKKTRKSPRKAPTVPQEGTEQAKVVSPPTKAPRKAGKPKQGGFSPNQKLALCVGGIAGFVLLLSVWECTTALACLTGMPLVLAGLLAIGIDCGMVASEIVASATIAGEESRKWAERYVSLAVALSVVLNAVSAASHGEGAWKLAGALCGACVPVLVYVAGRVAGACWQGK